MSPVVVYGPRIRRALLGAAVVMVPIAMLPRYLFDPINTPKLALLVVLVASALGLRCAEIVLGADVSGLRLALVPAAALGLPLVVGWLFSEHRYWELFGLYPRYLGLLPYLLFALLIVLIADAFAGRGWTLAWSLLLGGGLVGLYSLIQVLQIDPFVWSVNSKVLGIERTGASLGNPNFSGAYLATVLPAGLLVALRGPGRRDWAWVLVGLITLGLISSFSQGPWLAAAGGTALVLGYLARERRTWAVKAGLVLAGLCAVASLGAVASTMVSEKAADLLGSTVESRGWFWETAFEMGTERPLTGWGPNVYAAEGVRFRPADEALRAYWIAEDPHNLVLSYGVAAGILGLGGLAITLLWVVRRSKRALTGIDPAVAFAGAAVAYALQGLVGVDETGVRLAGWTCISGLAATLAPTPEPSAPKTGSFRSVAAPVAALALVAGGAWFALASVAADRSLLLGFRAAQDNLPEEASDHFGAALTFRDEYGYRKIYGQAMGELGTRRGSAGEPYIEEMERAFAYLDDFPDVTGLVAKARLLYAWGVKVEPSTLEESLTLFDRARTLDPHHPLLAVETSDVLRALSRVDEALNLLLGFADENPPYASFHGALALVYVELGDEAAARAEAGLALSIDEDDPRALEALDSM